MRLLVFCAIVPLCTTLVASEPAGFIGKVVVELLDDIEFDHKLRLIEDFSFRDANGRVWLARRNGVIDGVSIPVELRPLVTLPFARELRKASVVHDYFVRLKTEPWQEVHRMFYSANRAEGVSPPEAKIAYMTVYAGGWRWEPRGSSCYRSCHAAADMLAWKPVVTHEDLKPLVDWIWQSDPELDAIDAKADTVIRKPGPHIFSQVR